MSEPLRFRSKAVAIEAISFDGDNHNELIAFTFGCFETIDPADREDDPEAIAQVFYQRYDIWLPVKAGMWIARDVHGYFPIRAEDLAEKYEPVDAPERNILTWPRSIKLNRENSTVDLPLDSDGTRAAALQLTFDEARELHDMLSALLGDGGGDE